MGKKAEKKKRRAAAAAAEAEGADDEPDELNGFVEGGDLYLRDPASGKVFSSERAENGRLCLIGHWDAATSKIIPLPPATADPSPSDPAPPPAAPHPPPEPLAFEADEEDHCETAPDAYAHITPLLTLAAQSLGKSDPASLRIYDPFFCNGAVVRHLAKLGFPHVHNVNECFYGAQAAGTLPEHDVVVTNPPYSGMHPQLLLRHLARCGKPWAALMPNWVYARDYYRSELPPSARPFYIVPRKRYYYWTPRGRRSDVSGSGSKAKTHGHTNAALGARTSPFISFWYCGGLPSKAVKRLRPPEGCVLARSLDELPAGVRDESDPRRWQGREPQLGGKKRKRE